MMNQATCLPQYAFTVVIVYASQFFSMSIIKYILNYGSSFPFPGPYHSPPFQEYAMDYFNGH